MADYILAVYGFGRLPEELPKSLGKILIQSYLMELSSNDKYKDEKLFGKITLIQFIKLTLPWKEGWHNPLEKPKAKLDADYFGIPIDVLPGRIKKEDIEETEEFIYRKSLELKMMDQADCVNFLQEKKSPSKIFATDPKIAVDLLDEIISKLLFSGENPS